MNRIVFLFAVGVCFAIGQALECYKCSIGIGSLCITTKTTCREGELCFSGVGKAVGFVDIKMKGCLVRSKCNDSEEVTIPTHDSNATLYHMLKTCCDGDLCNAAPGLPGTSVLSLAVATVSAMFVANVLV